MILKIKPSHKLKGTIQLPTSKSYSIRAIIIAALGGESKIVHPSDCDDAQVARSVAKSLGAHLTESLGVCRVSAFKKADEDFKN